MTSFSKAESNAIGSIDGMSKKERQRIAALAITSLGVDDHDPRPALRAIKQGLEGLEMMYDERADAAEHDWQHQAMRALIDELMPIQELIVETIGRIDDSLR